MVRSEHGGSAAITLVRHGKPDACARGWVNGSGFARWIRSYDHCGLDAESLPPPELRRQHDRPFVISSHTRRAIDSATRALGRAPDLLLHDLREADLPRYRTVLRLPVSLWLIISRIAWAMGAGGGMETLRQTRWRAARIARQLHGLSAEHDHIVVFGHGLTNLLVAGALRRLGWNGRRRPLRYWEWTRLARCPATPR